MQAACALGFGAFEKVLNLMPFTVPGSRAVCGGGGGKRICSDVLSVDTWKVVKFIHTHTHDHTYTKQW